ncbi:histidine--tRNA ligase [Sulfurimonas sp. HSL-1716]|uniref:histidine--tRNA ligase n=1 Tax=Hydrocurvibacter sulfurireducens TaxID=3131937 RepID=UPI0031F7C6B3
MIQSLRGMNDIIDSARFEYFLKVATKIAKNYGFSYMETPLLEETALFKRSVGESSDIVGKEMYQFTDKGDNDVCLRPEGTAGVVRAFVQNKFDKAGGTYKFFYHGPMFRYERPQKGRLREFHQFGVESFGEESVYEDATMIMMIADILNKLGIGYRLKLNSLGDSSCMPAYRDGLVEFLESHHDEICEDCLRRKGTNPIRVLDCKNEKCQVLYINAPKLINSLCSGCNDDFEKLKSILISNNIDFEVDTHLVRGLDYYSKTAFEFVSDNIGAQSAIAGGGRYDRLVEFLDGKATPAVGFAIGIERLLELIKMPEEEREGYYFGAMDDDAVELVISLAQAKRKTDKASVLYKARNLKAHLKNADKANARFCAIIGENELKESKIWIKDLQEKTERIIPISEI